MYRIQQLSQMTGISAETIRYYERIGLMPPASRADNKYRQYDDVAAQRLAFIRRARHFDFSLDHIRDILAIRDHETPPCDLVLDLIRQKTTEIQARIQELEQLKDELHALQRYEQSPHSHVEKDCVCQILETPYER